jgi:hypothetical protein
MKKIHSYEMTPNSTNVPGEICGLSLNVVEFPVRGTRDRDGTMGDMSIDVPAENTGIFDLSSNSHDRFAGNWVNKFGYTQISDDPFTGKWVCIYMIGVSSDTFTKRDFLRMCGLVW